MAAWWRGSFTEALVRLTSPVYQTMPKLSASMTIEVVTQRGADPAYVSFHVVLDTPTRSDAIYIDRRSDPAALW